MWWAGGGEQGLKEGTKVKSPSESDVRVPVKVLVACVKRDGGGG